MRLTSRLLLGLRPLDAGLRLAVSAPLSCDLSAELRAALAWNGSEPVTGAGAIESSEPQDGESMTAPETCETEPSADDGLREERESVERDAYFRSMTANATDVVLVLSAGGRVRYESPATGYVLGYEPHGLVGHSVFELLDPATAASAVAAFAGCARGADRSRQIAWRVRHANGSWRELEGTIVNLLGDPVLGAILVNASDVTERRHAEEARQRLAAIVDAALDLIATMDPYGRLLSLNSAGRRLLGLGETEDVTHLNLQDLHPHWVTERLLAEGLTAAAATGVWSGETAVLAADGREVPVSHVMVAHSNPDGGLAYFSTIARDITARRSTEEQLRRSEEHFRSLIENGSDIIVVVGADGRLHYASPSIERALGYPPEALIDSDLWTLLHPDDGAAAALVLAASLSGEVPPAEFRLRHRDGSWRFIEARGKELPGDDSAERVVLNMRDLTERIELEAQFRQAQKMEAIGTLAGGVAHDFNNLLTAIRGYAEDMLDEVPAAAEFREELGEIVQAADRAAALTRQLLAFSRKQVMRPKVLDPNRLVANVHKMLRRVIGENIDLSLQLDPGAGHVQADPSQLEQVLLNLVVNARDAMPEGGKLCIATGREELAAGTLPACIAEATPGSYMVLRVSDTGCGIGADTLARMFEPFFTTKDIGKGTGLGLSTVYGIVKQSGGHICVESVPGAGSTFSVYLPHVEDLALASSAAAVPLAAAPNGKETVLLVEDEEAVRRLARRVLEKRGYTVLEAADATEAELIASACMQPIHLLLTDIMMPGLDGRELADRLLLRDSNLAVMFMSGYDESTASRRHALPAGSGFIEKPFTPRSLAESVRELLDTRESAGTSARLPRPELLHNSKDNEHDDA